LLKAHGKLVLVEVTGSSAMVDMVGGAQAGYWHGVGDGRVQRPFLDVAAWDVALRSAGYSGPELVLDDYPSPWTKSNVMVVGLADDGVDGVNGASDHDESPDHMHLLHSTTEPPPILTQLAHALQCRGLRTTTMFLDNAHRDVPTDAHIVAFLDDDHLLLAADERRLGLFQHLARHASSVMWLTSTGMVVGRNPNGAVVGGLLRTLSTESPTGRFCSIDLDADHFALVDPQQTEDLVRIIVEREVALQQSQDGESIEDREFVWHSGCLWVCRLVPEPALSSYAEPLVTPNTHIAELLPLSAQGPVLPSRHLIFSAHCTFVPTLSCVNSRCHMTGSRSK
jgi:hypothetical protein